MASPHQDRIKCLETRFREAWAGQDRPLIADFLANFPNDVEQADQKELLAALLPIDIESRRKMGEQPHAHDYLQLGPAAVAMAQAELQESLGSVETSRDLDVTAFHSSAQLTKDGDYSFVEARTRTNNESPMEFIGPYKLLEKIGEGGMGSVWKAEQEEPVKRLVALKVIRADLDSEQSIARFEAERQAIALMDHQNIAKILDAGKTNAGNPYFVMELVDGIPLNDYCDQQRLNVRERLELMVPVCRAVQHAHQKGIIHRDLKHSNVLVTQYDGKPVPKVIDFGLAKAFEHQHKLTDKTMFTEFGKVVGTVQYMSPEQAEMSNVDIDTRTDVYSLGAMLYKLLTGSTPLPKESIADKSLMEVLQFIREKEPPRPSSRLSSSSHSIEEICQQRQIAPEKMRQALKGDLDWIVMKALEKDRQRRYETANGLAMDLERYLTDQAVMARPPSTGYRFQKFVKRNRGLVASMAGFTVLLLGGIIATSSAMVWALQESERANQNAIAAKTEAKNALKAEKEARDAEQRQRKLQLLAESQLHAIRMKSAWSDWQLGNVQSAWQMLGKLADTEGGWESRFLRTEFTSSEKVLYGHAHFVKSLDQSNDGKFIATAGEDHTVKIWNAKTKQLVFTRKINGGATCVRFSPNSKSVACSDRSNRITLWEVASGELQKELGPYAHDILSIAFCPGGETLLAGAAEGDSYQENANRKYRNFAPPVLRVISVDDGAILHELKGHSKDINAVACAPDGETLVSGSKDKTICIWKKQSNDFRLAKTLTGHIMNVTDVAVSSTGKYIASCGQDKTVRLWALDSGDLVRTMVGHTDPVNGVAFSTDETRIVSASADRTARVWNLAGEELLICQGHFDTVNDVRFSVDGTEILTAGEDKTVRVWNAKNKPSTVVVRGHTDAAWCVDFSPDGKTIASGSEDGTFALIDVESGDLIGPKVSFEKAVLAVAQSPSAPLVIIAGADAKFHVWDKLKRKVIKTVEAHKDFIWDLDFSADGALLATASSDKTVKIWNTADWSLVTQLVGHVGELACARFSPDGRFIVTGSDDKTIKLWNAESFDLIHDFFGHENAVWKAIFSPDGKTIASSSYDGEVILWDVTARKIIRRINAHPDQIAGLAFSHDGQRVVSASDDETIRIWDIESGIELFVLRDKNDSAIVHVSFSDDGTKLVSGNAEGWITIRSAKNLGKNVQPFLPQKAVEFAIKGLPAVTASDATAEDLQGLLKNAEKCTRFYPAYDTYTIRGIAQYRLGQFDKSVVSLVEADRLEPIQYGEPDVRPHIEGFLAMAYLKTGQTEQAKTLRRIYDQKCKTSIWSEDEMVLEMTAEVDRTFNGVSQ